MVMNDDTNNKSLWEVTTDDEGPKLAEPGDYLGQVIWVEEGEYAGGAKIGLCRCVTVTIQFQTPDGKRDVTDRFYNWPSVLWRVSAFCRAVGVKRHGEACRFSWQEMMGRRLKFHLARRSYTGRDGERHLTGSIDRYYDFDPENFPPEEAVFEDVRADDELPF